MTVRAVLNGNMLSSRSQLTFYRVPQSRTGLASKGGSGHVFSGEVLQVSTRLVKQVIWTFGGLCVAHASFSISVKLRVHT